MAKLLKLRRGTTSQHSSFTGAEGEVTIDTDKDTAVVHDGSTAAGRPLAREDLNNVASASITGRLASGSIAGAKIANDAIDSQHYVDGSIDEAHIGTGQVTGAKLAAGAVSEASKIANSIITGAKIGSGTITASNLATDSVTGTQIADNAINSEHYVDGSIDNAHLASNSVDSNQIVAGAIDHGHLSNDCIDGDNIQNDVINSEHIAADSIDAEHYAPNSVDADALAHTSVTAGSYGSATAIPAITVDAQGRITAASTNTVNTTTNLGTSTASGSVTVTSSTGNNATISEATSSAAGVMSTAHHDKLDGIAAGATNVTNTNQLTNGAGFITSADGGNAATLDGIDSSQFLRSDANDTASGAINFSGGKIGLKSTPGNTFGNRNAAFCLGDNDTGFAQNGDGQLEAWANNSHVTTWDGTGPKINMGYGSLAHFYGVRFWVNFHDGGSIQNDQNVSSVSDVSEGEYIVYIDTDMPDSNYAVVGTNSNGNTSWADGDDTGDDHLILGQKGNGHVYVFGMDADDGNNYDLEDVNIIGVR